MLNLRLLRDILSQRFIAFVRQSLFFALKAVGVLRLPVPGVSAHIVEVALGLPAELFFGEGGVRPAGVDIPRSPRRDDVGQLSSAGALEGV